MSTPDKNGDVNILTSAVVYDESRGYPVRYLFGIKKVGPESRPTIEMRNANTGEFIKDYTTMETSNIGQLQIGNYIFTPHTNTADGAVVNNSLSIEYIGG